MKSIPLSGEPFSFWHNLWCKLSWCFVKAWITAASVMYERRLFDGLSFLTHNRTISMDITICLYRANQFLIVSSWICDTKNHESRIKESRIKSCILVCWRESVKKLHERQLSIFRFRSELTPTVEVCHGVFSVSQQSKRFRKMHVKITDRWRNLVASFEHRLIGLDTSL